MLRPGPLALVQDLGRPGHAALGVPPSGALDAPALELANALVGNPADAAGLELLLGGALLRADVPCVIAVTGPPVQLKVDKEPVYSHQPIELKAGQQIRIGTPKTGLRVYLAVHGGIDVPQELGSRSTDTLSGIGPQPLKADDTLPLATPELTMFAARNEPRTSSTPGPLIIRVTLGPRDDWFLDAETQLSSGEWTVSPQSNRVGLRLSGTRLERSIEGELPSEGLVTGAIQVPAGGEPVIFLNDRPTTGGYPVIGTVHPADLPLLAQARPGTTVRMTLDVRG
ncbi:biotin-dependent carboxyltransferase family protein [Pseudonocardiaceae bacterium YIM PH 21723]|nr:biotin-dependent carboxyltransferase family protein [Pseudonocardiaceae bacterium YIM PH 21723]